MNNLTAKKCNVIIQNFSDQTLIKYRDTNKKYDFIVNCIKSNTQYFANEKNITLFENAIIRACVLRVNLGNMNKNNVLSWNK